MAWKPNTGPSRTATTRWRNTRRRAQTEIALACTECGSTNQLELDHIIPVCEGGADEMCNLQWLCRDCHKLKTQGEAQRARHRVRNGLDTPLGFALDVVQEPSARPHL